MGGIQGFFIDAVQMIRGAGELATRDQVAQIMAGLDLHIEPGSVGVKPGKVDGQRHHLYGHFFRAQTRVKSDV